MSCSVEESCQIEVENKNESPTLQMWDEDCYFRHENFRILSILETSHSLYMGPFRFGMLYSNVRFDSHMLSDLKAVSPFICVHTDCCYQYTHTRAKHLVFWCRTHHRTRHGVNGTSSSHNKSWPLLAQFWSVKIWGGAELPYHKLARLPQINDVLNQILCQPISLIQCVMYHILVMSTLILCTEREVDFLGVS